MKRGFEAHMILYLSLSNLFYHNLLKVYPLTQINLVDKLAKLKGNIQSSKGYLKELVNESLSKMQDDGLLKKIKQFDEGLNYQVKFFLNYMKMSEVLLLFIRSSHKENWELHLVTLELMIPYFIFAFPIKLSPFPTFIDCNNDGAERKWRVSSYYLKDNFSINKTVFRFARWDQIILVNKTTSYSKQMAE